MFVVLRPGLRVGVHGNTVAAASHSHLSGRVGHQVGSMLSASGLFSAATSGRWETWQASHYSADQVRSGEFELRVATEVQQILVRLNELWGRPHDWAPPTERERPVVLYFQRAVRKVIESLKRQLAEDAAQKGIFEWVSCNLPPPASPSRIPRLATPRTAEQIAEDTRKTIIFWSQMRSAAIHGVKDCVEWDTLDLEVTPQSSPLQAWSSRMLIDLPESRTSSSPSPSLAHGSGLRLSPRLDQDARPEQQRSKTPQPQPTSQLRPPLAWTSRNGPLPAVRLARPPKAGAHLVRETAQQGSCLTPPKVLNSAEDPSTVGKASKTLKPTVPSLPGHGGFWAASLATQEREAHRFTQKTLPSMVGTSPPEPKGADSALAECRPAVLGEWWPSSGVTRYLHATAEAGTVPLKHEMFLGTRSSFINLSDQRLDDAALGIMMETMLRSKAPTALDLSRNRIVHGVQALLRTTALELDLLDLSHNPLSASTIGEIGVALRAHSLKVRRLILCSVNMPSEALQDICASIARAKFVSKVCLSDIQVGRHRQDCCRWVGHLCVAVDTLDISYNYFRGQGLARLSGYLNSKACKVQHLSLANNVWCQEGVRCSSRDDCDVDPMQLFCEALGDNTTLRRLDLSGCQLESGSLFCLEDSLAWHATLQSLDVSRNPLGLTGLRSLIRTVADDRNKVRQAYAGELRTGTSEPEVCFNPTNRAEEFRAARALQLNQPHHRAILRLLLLRAERLRIKPGTALRDFSLDGVRRSPTFQRAPSGRPQVPSRGTASFTAALLVPGDKGNPSDAVAHWHRSRRIPVGFVKFVALVLLWRQQETAEERRLFLYAASRDLCYKLTQVKFFVREAARCEAALVPQLFSQFGASLERVDRAVLISALGREPCLRGGTSKSVLRSFYKGTRARAVKEVGGLSGLNLESLTGRHSFDLDIPASYSAVDRALIAVHWEAAAASKLQLLDTTQVGGYVGIRNFTLDDVLTLYSLEWQLPGDGFKGSGRLVFDYVTPLGRPDRQKCKTLACLSPSHFQGLLSVLRGDNTDATEEARFQALGASVHRFHVNAIQLRGVMAALPRARTKEVYVTLFPRCLDFGAPLNHIVHGVLADRDLLSAEDVFEITRRLGIANTFDALNIHRHPYNRFQFDLSLQDDRICVWLLMQMAKREEGENLKECKWTGLSERCDTAYWTIPGTWFQELQTEGVLTLSYVCQEQHVRNQRRAELAVELLGWVVTATTGM